MLVRCQSADDGTMRGVHESTVLGAIVVRDPTGSAAPHGVRDGIAARVFQAEDVSDLVRDDVGLFIGRTHGETRFIHDYFAFNPFGHAATTACKRPGVPVLDVYEHRLDGGAKGGKRSKDECEDVGSHAHYLTPASQPRGRR